MKLFAAVTMTALAAFPVAANEYAPAMANYLDTQVRSWANNPAIIDMVVAQNERHAGISQSEIDALDKAWRAEVGSSSMPTVTEVMKNSAADFLRAQVDASGGMITEVFVMDYVGLNVAVSAPTSDMWQGDEAKFTQTYPKGPDAVHFGEVEFDESSQTYQAQISIPLVHPETGDVVGAMTVAVDAEALL